jgi:hypothetical protein
MMSLKARRELLAAVSPRYRQALSREKERILDGFVQNTGYHRKYAIKMLTTCPASASPGNVGVRASTPSRSSKGC